MFSRRRSLFDIARARLAKGPRRVKRRGDGRGVKLGMEQLEDRRMLAVRALPGFETNTLMRGDDVFGFANLPFEVDFFGDQYDQLSISTNGYVSFGDFVSQGEIIPGFFGETQDEAQFADLQIPIIAPFWSDVDTGNIASGLVTYGVDTVDGRSAFGVNWIDVAFDGGPNDITNSFQLLLIDRSDIAPLAFDVEFNYDEISWETGADSGGDDGFGGATARVGFSAPYFIALEQYELIGSGDGGALLDSNATAGLINNSLRSLDAGRYVFEFRDETPLNEIGLAGQAIYLADDVIYFGAGVHPLSLPLKNVPVNANSIDTSDADRITIGGSLNTNLTGADVTVGVVEANERPGNSFDSAGNNRDAAGNFLQSSPFVRVTHNDLAGRTRTPGVTPTTFAHHATHVAGIIGGDGSTNGYAPGTKIRSFGITDAYGIAPGNIAGIDITNHSYGSSSGWDFIFESDLIAAQVRNVSSPNIDINGNGVNEAVPTWLADRTIGQEDPRFGIYSQTDASIDAFLTAPGRENLLRVQAAGNDRNDSFQVFDQIKSNRYLTFFSGGFGGDNRPGWYLAPASGNTLTVAPPSDGNLGTGHDSVNPGSAAKNVITVGSIKPITVESGIPDYSTALSEITTLSEFSNFGPLDDGRLAIHLVANGDKLRSSGARTDLDLDDIGGTSQASPSVVGVAALMLEHYRELANSSGSSLPATPTSATLRGILMHTAEDMLTSGPDYATGYGLVQGDAAIQFVGSAAGSDNIPSRFDRVIQDTFTAAMPARRLTVPAGRGQEVIATIAWNDPVDPSRRFWSPGAAFPPNSPPNLPLDSQLPVLVNNLNLTITSPDGTVFRSWVLDRDNPANAATTGTNNVDNVEQVRFDAPLSGDYTISVSTASGGLGLGTTQDFSFLLTVAGDSLEDNNSIETATVLGSESEITIRDLSIHNDTDVDFFQITAHDTGKLIINAFFEDAIGDIDLQIQDSSGNVIVSSLSTTDNEQIIIPVVAQEMYFVRVSGDAGQTNGYDLEIENFPTPVPTGVHLDPASDTGTSNHDNVTSNTQPQFFIQTDVLNFVDTDGNLLADDGDITVLTPAQAAAGLTDGIAVEVTLINTTDNTVVRGFAAALPAISPEVYSFTPTAPLTDGVYFVTARTVIFDSREIDADPGTPGVQRETGRSNASSPLWFTVIGGGGIAMANADLLNSSDSGMYDDDNVTANWKPAFQGVAPANSTVRLYANGELVGSTVAGSDSSDVGIGGVNGLGGANNDGFGVWEITSEPLVENGYDITLEIEDGAGNVTVVNPTFNPAVPAVDIVIDKTEPNTPLLDLQNDTGEDLHDEITNVANPNFFMTTTDPNIALAQMLFMDNLKFRIFDRHDANPETLIYDSATDAVADGMSSVVGQEAMFTSLTALTRALNLLDGTHNLKLEVEDRAGNISPDFLLEVVVDTAAPVAVTPNLLASSDSGMFNDDNVTNKMQPAFDGTTEVNTKVTVFAQSVNPATGLPVGAIQLIGGGTVGSDATDGNAANGLGVWEVTVEPLVDGAWDITTRFEDWAGNLSAPSDALRIVVDTEAPNTPLLDLLDDTGRSDVDNITKVNQPRVFMTTTDPNVQFSEVLFTDNFKFRIFDRFESTAEILIYNSATDVTADNVTTAGDMFTSLTALTKTLPGAAGTLADGVHNLKLEVEDRAGNISHDFLMEIIVDTVTPPVSFGLPDAASQVDGLAAESDSGVTTMPTTFSDRITNDTTPRLWGRAEADTIVGVYHDRNANGIIDLGFDEFLGQTVATPFNGNDAYPDGYWEIVSALDFNQLGGFAKDGLRRLLVTAEDVAGNPMPMGNQIADGVDSLNLFIDTQGPQVYDPAGTTQAVHPTIDPTYDLFDPKPSANGFTPLTNRITINLRDLPLRSNVDPNFLYEALKTDLAAVVGNYSLVGDHVGTIGITNVEVVNAARVNGQQATATVTLTFADFLPDDRYTLVASDNLVDPVGNNLDGESNANGPLDDPTFPSGDGVPGGDFVARFTIDSRPEIGSFVAQNIDIDINGNFVWDPANAQIGNDATNVDLTFRMNVVAPGGGIGSGGYGVHDLVFAGKFTNGAAPTSGRLFDQLAVFGWETNLAGQPVGKRWLVDTNSDGVINTADGDIFSVQPLLANFEVGGAIPVAGDFDNNPANGDEIGLYNAGQWALDTNRDFVIQASEVRAQGNLLGHPIVGNFDGVGGDDFAVFNNNQFLFDLNNDFIVDQTMTWGFPGVLDRPVATDMNQDGIDDIGLWVPRNSAQSNRPTAEWYFLISDAALQANGTINAINHPFTPVPFGDDLYAEFGDELALPIVGNFDPPVVAGNLTNQGVEETGDFDQDGDLDGSDFLMWQRGLGTSVQTSMSDGDGNSDGVVNAYDLELWASGFQANVAATSDYTGDGVVDGADLSAWESGLGAVATPGGAVGDSDGDGDVDGSDFLSWQRSLSFHSSVAASTVASSIAAAPPALSTTAPSPLTTSAVEAGLTPKAPEPLALRSVYVGSFHSESLLPLSAKRVAFDELEEEMEIAYVDAGHQFLASTSSSPYSSRGDEWKSPNGKTTRQEQEAWDLAFDDEDDLLLAGLF